MACNRPLTAYRRSGGGIGFHDQPGDTEALKLPCGRCVGCRMDRAAAWMVRCQHEAQLYDANCFVTLTYDDDHLPRYGSLHYPDVQLFMKRLRKRFAGVSPGPNGKHPIRFFAAGEYGTENLRPHYHILLFNHDWPDKEPIGRALHTSQALSDLWPHGLSSSGALTPASAAYVARYALKKVYGRLEAEAYYEPVDYVTGEVHSRRPEFAVMSRRPGIGSWWYDRFERDVLPCDYVVVAGKKYRVPRYYSDKFEQSHPEAYGGVLEERESKIAAIPLEYRNAERRSAAEAVASAKLKLFSERKL